MLPLGDPDAAPLLLVLGEHERYATWRLVRRDGSVSGRGRGGIELLRSLMLTRAAGRVLALVPGRALEAAYELVARHRQELGRLVPDGPAPRRYP